MTLTDEWKVLILQRWAGEFPPAREDYPQGGLEPPCGVALKSSQEIADDLSGAGSFTADEVSAFMAVNGYSVVFDAGYPKWRIKINSQLRINNE